jgi:divalent metal cation (Fe/Co/Zn/Cd) transporter
MVHDIWAYSVEEDYYLELHLEANGALALHAAHNLASELETRIQAELPKIARITSHIEPQGQGITEAEDKEMAAEVEALDGEVCHLVNQRLGGDTCHNLRIQQRAGNWDISFHCRLPGQMSLAEAHRTSTTLEIALRRALPNLGRVTIHTEPLREPEPSLTEAS